jgi:hypothetical protein
MASAKSKSTENSKRAVVTGITINLSYPDGSSRTVTVDPKRTEAIFWSDRAAMEILAPFYSTIEKSTTAEEMALRFGEHVLELCGKKGEVKITPEFIRNLWRLPNKQGVCMPFILKTIKCIPNGY